VNARLIISFSRRLRAIWLNDSVRAPISSREVTASATSKFPSAMARVPWTSRLIRRESKAASPTPPPMPRTTITNVITAASLRARVSATSMARWLKPR
jgi:hypothetical protein